MDIDNLSSSNKGLEFSVCGQPADSDKQPLSNPVCATKRPHIPVWGLLFPGFLAAIVSINKRPDTDFDTNRNVDTNSRILFRCSSL